MGRLPRLPLAILERAGSPATGVWPATTSPTVTWRLTASSARMVSPAKTTPPPFLAWTAATLHSPTHSVRSVDSSLAAGRGYTVQLPPSVRHED